MHSFLIPFLYCYGGTAKFNVACVVFVLTILQNPASPSTKSKFPELFPPGEFSSLRLSIEQAQNVCKRARMKHIALQTNKNTGTLRVKIAS